MADKTKLTDEEIKAQIAAFESQEETKTSTPKPQAQQDANAEDKGENAHEGIFINNVGTVQVDGDLLRFYVDLPFGRHYEQSIPFRHITSVSYRTQIPWLMIIFAALIGSLIGTLVLGLALLPLLPSFDGADIGMPVGLIAGLVFGFMRFHLTKIRIEKQYSAFSFSASGKDKDKMAQLYEQILANVRQAK